MHTNWYCSIHPHTCLVVEWWYIIMAVSTPGEDLGAGEALPQAGAVVAQPAAGTFAADGVAVVVMGRVVYQFRARRAFLGPCTRALLEAGVALAVRACRCPRPRSRTPHWWQRGSWACTCPGWGSRWGTPCAGTRSSCSRQSTDRRRRICRRHSWSTRRCRCGRLAGVLKGPVGLGLVESSRGVAVCGRGTGTR